MTPTEIERRLRRRLGVACLRPVDGAWLAVLRIALGLALAVSMERFLAYGWVDSLLVGPTFRFHYYGFAVVPLSHGTMHALFVVLACLALATAAGFVFRVAAPLLALGLTYIQLVDVSTYLNHYYLAALLAWLLALSPANRVWSVDAWIARRRGRTRAPTIAAAWHVLFRVQVGVVYVFAGLAKAQPDWLVHAQPLRMWLGASTDVPVLGRLFMIPGAPLAMSWAGFLFDLTIVLWLSWRRTRLAAYAVVLVFHTLTRVLFDIGMFPILMSIAALVFFDADWPRRLTRLARLALVRTRRSSTATTPHAAAEGPATASESGAVLSASPRPTFATRAALALGALHCLAQIVLPLRTHLYGGDVLWHEQGMRFSWRVMVRAKGGATTFLVRDKATGQELHVGPRAFLTPFQENEMASQPDLILQLAHHIADVYGPRTSAGVEVRASTLVSLNGRRGVPMIDPSVDLATIHDGLGSAAWILPAPTEPPPHTRPVR